MLNCLLSVTFLMNLNIFKTSLLITWYSFTIRKQTTINFYSKLQVIG
jgi:hypothetical protein